MKWMIAHIRHADKWKLLLFLCSYAIYRLVNNGYSEVVLTLLHEDDFKQIWTAHSIPCQLTPHTFIISFQVFKVVLFVLFVFALKRNLHELVREAFVAYFIYDLVYLLATVWDRIPFPVALHSRWMLVSSGQIFLTRYYIGLDLLFAGLWTLALILVMRMYSRISPVYLANRLVIICISVPLISYMIYFIRLLFA